MQPSEPTPVEPVSELEYGKPNPQGCGRPVDVYTHHDGTPLYKPCGKTYMMETVLCAECEAEAHRQYPQGWSSYPGDVCKHGVYVGGCGADYMCGACENGDE